MKHTQILAELAGLTGTAALLQIGTRIPLAGYDLAAEDGKVYDLVFITGDHSSKQSEADLKTALALLSPDGVVVMHASLPASAAETVEVKPGDSRPWCGGVYRTVIKARKRTTLLVYTVDCDHGVTIIRSRPKGYAGDYKMLPTKTKLPTFAAWLKKRALFGNVVAATEIPALMRELKGLIPVPAEFEPPAEVEPPADDPPAATDEPPTDDDAPPVGRPAGE